MKTRASLLTLAVAAGFAAPAAAGAKMPRLYQRCAFFNARYPHGVGKVGARDETKSASSEPVTNFVRSNEIYRLAMKYNKRLDADKDGVACEKH